MSKENVARKAPAGGGRDDEAGRLYSANDREARRVNADGDRGPIPVERKPVAREARGQGAVEPSDEGLMARLAKGDGSALEALMARYQTDIFRFCLHYLKEVERARELTQETFIRVFSASARFDESRRFRPWVLCIARNLCLNELKRRKTVPMESFEEFAASPRAGSSEAMRSSVAPPDEQAMTGESMELLSRALDSLSEEAREIVTLRFFQGMAAREIAEIVGGTEGAVRTKLHRIMMSLRDRYQDSRKDY